jgi:hypothetical protein
MTKPKSKLAPAITLLTEESKRLLPGTYEERTRGEALLRAAQWLRQKERESEAESAEQVPLPPTKKLVRPATRTAKARKR